MDDCKKHFYWVATNDGHEDWFVVGLDQYTAESFFANNQGYDLEELSSIKICVADFEEKNDLREEAYYPSHEMLSKNGFECISEDEPRIFWRAGKKYCQGNLVQNIIITKGQKQSGVYIVAVRDSNLYKIGVTKDIEKRLYQLQTGNPYEFYLTEFFPTPKSRELESLLHKKFKLNRYKREWFKLTGEEVLEACYFAQEFVGKPNLKIDNQGNLNIQQEVPKSNKKSTDDDLPF